MPNWCFNVVEVSHDDPALLVAMNDAFNAKALFNTYHPMPDGVDWRKWRVANWGVKWEPEFESDECSSFSEPRTTLCMWFDTAWSPPIEFYDKLKSLGYNVVALYHEPLMNVIGTYNDGDLDDHSGYDDLNTVPAKLREFFNLDGMTADA